MLALYVGVFNYIALLWDYINYAFPDPLAYNYGYTDPYQSGISWEMASLIVLTPLFLLLMWYIRKTIARDPSRADVWVRRWHQRPKKGLCCCMREVLAMRFS